MPSHGPKPTPKLNMLTTPCFGMAATGKRKQQWLSLKGTKKDAERRLSEMLHQMDTGSFVSPSRLTVGAFLRQWLVDFAKPNTAARTYERYAELVRTHLDPGLGSIPLSVLKPHHIQSFYAKALDSGRLDGKGGLSAQTVLHLHRLLFQALRFGVRQGVIGRNVGEAVSPPRPKFREMPFTDSQGVAMLLRAFEGSEYYALIFTAAFTGLRRSELLALTWQDLDLDMATLSVKRSLHRLRSGEYILKEPKSRRGRRNIALSPSLALMLRQRKETQSAIRRQLGTELKDTDLVFSHIDGSPIRPDTITRAFRTKAKEVGLTDLTFHGLRHAHAVLMLESNVHPKIVSEMLGHSSVSITLDLYSHVVPSMGEAAARRFEEVVGYTPEGEKKDSVSNPLAKRSYVNALDGNNREI